MPGQTVARDTLQKIADIYTKAHQELRRLGTERRAIVAAAFKRQAEEKLKAIHAKIAGL